MGADTTTPSEAGAAAPVDSLVIFCRCCLLSLSVIVLAMLVYLAIVTVVNPRQLLWSPFHIFPPVTLNSRSIKLELFQEYDAEARVAGLIMGASTSQQMSPEVFQQITGERFFNAAVFAATPRDYLAQYRLLKRGGARLNVLLIGIDATSLREAPEFYELKSNWPMQTALDPGRAGRFFEVVHWVGVYKDTFSAQYVDEVHYSIGVYIRRQLPAMVFEPDGRVDFLAWDHVVADHPDRDSEISSCTDLHASWLSTPVIISAKQQSALEQLIREARADNVEVRLWITPYHPKFFGRLAASPEAAGNLSRVRTYLNGLQDRFGISVFDLSDESSFGGDPGAWYDCRHIRDANLRLVANKVMGNASLRYSGRK